MGGLVVQPAVDVGESRGSQPLDRSPRASDTLRRHQIDAGDSMAASLIRRRFPAPPHWAASGPSACSTSARLANNRSWSGTQWKVAVDRMASTGSIGMGSRRSCVTYAIRSCPRRIRARSSIEGDASSATTSPRGSRSRSASVTWPVPHPASRTRSSPRSGNRLDDGHAPPRHGDRQSVVGGGVPIVRHGGQASGAGAPARAATPPRRPRPPADPHRGPRRPRGRS